MNALRIKSTIKRVGDPYMVGAASGFGVFRPLSPTHALRYLSQADVDANAPLKIGLVPSLDMTSKGDPLTWLGDDYTILYAGDIRHRGAVVARILIF